MCEKNSIKNERFKKILIDPCREDSVEKEIYSFESIFYKFPHFKGETVFDSELIGSNIERTKTYQKVNSCIPYLNKEIKVGFAYIDDTFQDENSKYEIKLYTKKIHDIVLLIIILTSNVLNLWSLNDKVKFLFMCEIRNFTNKEGVIKYYVPMIRENGEISYVIFLSTKIERIEGFFKEFFSNINYIPDLIEIAKNMTNLFWT